MAFLDDPARLRVVIDLMRPQRATPEELANTVQIYYYLIGDVVRSSPTRCRSILLLL